MPMSDTEPLFETFDAACDLCDLLYETVIPPEHQHALTMLCNECWNDSLVANERMEILT